MKRTLSLFKVFVLAMVFAIAGCATKPQERVVIKTEIKIVKTPESMLVPCDVTAPPERATYLTLSEKKKEEALSNYALDLLKDIRLCNVQVKKIKEFQDKQVKSLEENGGIK